MKIGTFEQFGTLNKLEQLQNLKQFGTLRKHLEQIGTNWNNHFEHFEKIGTIWNKLEQ